MIDQAIIKQLRESLAPYFVISRFVDLKKSGGNWIGRCPFHDESTPSFTVPIDRAKSFYHCFGCGAHGDVIDFMQKHAGLTFQQAVQELAGQAGMTVSHTRTASTLKATARFTPMPAAKDGHQVLEQDALTRLATWQAALDGSPAAKYLEQRRIPLSVAQSVGAGYLRAGQAMGLNAEGEPTGYGPRIVFPHSLPDGRIVNLYGRSIAPNADKARKHRHLPRAKGLLNPGALSRPGALWIVEGAFDALALMAAGVQKVVAVFGLDGFDWRWIGRHDLVVATDYDDAGRAAAQKLLVEAAYRGLKASRLPAECCGGHKDVADAWQAGVLSLAGWIEPGLIEPGLINADRWIALVQSIGAAPEPFLVRQWPQFKAMASRFATFHLADALAAGWTAEDLFSVPQSQIGADAGAAWMLADFRVAQIEVLPDQIAGTLESGSRLVYRRGRVSGVLPWSLPIEWQNDLQEELEATRFRPLC